MGDDKDDNAIAAVVEGAFDKIQEANQQVVEASAAMSTAATMLTYAVAEMVTPPVTGLGDPLLPA